MWIKPRVILIDETEYWEPGLAEQAGKIYGVHLFDENRIVHCCELQGSYELYSLECAVRNYDTIPEEVRDEIEDAWRMGTDPVSYVHTYAIGKVFCLDTQRCKADEYDEAWEGIMEWYQSNTPWYELPTEGGEKR